MSNEATFSNLVMQTQQTVKQFEEWAETNKETIERLPYIETHALDDFALRIANALERMSPQEEP